MSYQTLAPPASMLNKPRSQPEGILRYCLDEAPNMGDIHVTAPGACTYTASDEAIPTGDVLIRLAKELEIVEELFEMDGLEACYYGEIRWRNMQREKVKELIKTFIMQMQKKYVKS